MVDTVEPHAPPILAQVTIPAGETISNSFDCSTQRPLRCRMPPAWTPGGTDMITFQCSSDNASFMDMYDRTGNPWWSMVVTPNAVVPIEAEFGARIVDTFIRLKSSIPQAAARTFTFVLG